VWCGDILADRQTDPQTDILIIILRNRSRGRSKYQISRRLYWQNAIFHEQEIMCIFGTKCSSAVSLSTRYVHLIQLTMNGVSNNHLPLKVKKYGRSCRPVMTARVACFMLTHASRNLTLTARRGSLYCIYFWASWRGFSVITSPNPNLSG